MSVFIMASVTLLQWLSVISSFEGFIGRYPPMRKITAVLLIFSSVTLWAVASNLRWVVFLLRSTGILLIMVSLLTLVTFIPSSYRPFENFSLSILLSTSNRMAFHTAIIFLCLGAIKFLFSYNSKTSDNLAHVLFFPSAGLSYFVLLGYILNVTDIFMIAGIRIAPTSAVSLFLLSLTALLLKPDTWLMSILAGKGPGSVMARKMLPWLFILPILISWLRIIADQENYFSHEIGAITAAITYTISFIFLLWMSARNVNRQDEKRLKAFEALQVSEERQRALIRATSDAVYMMSADWSHVYNLRGGDFVDSVEERMDEWINKFIPPHAQPEVKKKISEAIETKTMFELEHEVYLIDGSLGWTLSRAVPLLDEKGDIIEWVGFAEDTTELRKAQDQLRIQERDEAMRKGAEEAMLKLNNELLRSNKELQQFAFLTSHDLQEPIRKIIMFTGILSNRLHVHSDKESERIMSKIVQSSHRMSSLINDLLAYSLIGSSTTPFTNVDFNEVFNSVVARHSEIIKSKKAKITSDKLPVVRGDDKQLYALLQNLVDNSLKFTHKQPVIHVSAKEEAEAYLFLVSDNGIGIEKQYSERIFLIFQRLVRREEYEGNGIGLAICKRIVERHGGKIYFNSEPGVGTTFYFTILK